MNYDRYINQAIAAVPPSGIRRFFDIAATMKDAISLGVGEPDFVTPYHIRNAAINSIIDGGTQYTGAVCRNCAGKSASIYPSASTPTTTPRPKSW